MVAAGMQRDVNRKETSKDGLQHLKLATAGVATNERIRFHPGETLSQNVSVQTPFKQ